MDAGTEEALQTEPVDLPLLHLGITACIQMQLMALFPQLFERLFHMRIRLHVQFIDASSEPVYRLLVFAGRTAAVQRGEMPVRLDEGTGKVIAVESDDLHARDINLRLLAPHFIAVQPFRLEPVGHPVGKLIDDHEEIAVAMDKRIVQIKKYRLSHAASPAAACCNNVVNSL